MKKLIGLTLFIVAIIGDIKAQDSTKNVVDSAIHKKVLTKVITQKVAQAFYAEAGGNSIIWSANYDRRFTKRLDGLGYRIGFGYFPMQHANVWVLPAGINILAGNKGHFVELGFNVTLAGSSPTDTLFSKFGQIDFSKKRTQIIYGTSMGYRYQKPDAKGFHFRVGFEPILGTRFDNEMAFALTAHLSLGYSF